MRASDSLIRSSDCLIRASDSLLHASERLMHASESQFRSSDKLLPASDGYLQFTDSFDTINESFKYDLSDRLQIKNQLTRIHQRNDSTLIYPSLKFNFTPKKRPNFRWVFSYINYTRIMLLDVVFQLFSYPLLRLYLPIPE